MAWLYTRVGHFAPVTDGANKNVIVIRARRADDLDALRKQFMPTLGPNEFDRNRDYNVRARLSKDDFVKGMTAIALDIDYPSYKQMIHHTEPARYSVYTKIWDATLGLSDCFPAEKHKSIYSKQIDYTAVYDQYRSDRNGV